MKAEHYSFRDSCGQFLRYIFQHITEENSADREADLQTAFGICLLGFV